MGYCRLEGCRRERAWGWEDGVMWQVLDPSRGLGMTVDKVGWGGFLRRRKGRREEGEGTGGWGGCLNGLCLLGRGVPPPARPFDAAQGERPLLGMDSRLGARQRRTCSIFDRLGGGMTERGVGLGLGHLGDAEVAGADLDAVYDPADLVVAELLEAKAV